jgi:hypothetical protein
MAKAMLAGSPASRHGTRVLFTNGRTFKTDLCTGLHDGVGFVLDTTGGAGPAGGRARSTYLSMYVRIARQEVRRGCTHLSTIQQDSQVRRCNMAVNQTVIDRFQTYAMALRTNFNAPLDTGIVWHGSYSVTFFSLSAFVMTDVELKLIAAAAIMGERRMPKNGYKTPAAIGTPAEL